MQEAMFYSQEDGLSVRCSLCAHRCLIGNGQYGLCRVRKNEGGCLYSLVYGKLIAAAVDPIEKKPLYHFLPGSQSFSIATVGCNFKCSFCQNWQISQLKDSCDDLPGKSFTPSEIVQQAKAAKCESISYTYTEPTIFFEYAYETARLAHKEGLKNIFVTNGYMTKEAVNKILPYLDACNIDLKAFSDEFYTRMCKAKLEPVLDTIKYLHEKGVWIEVTTLLIPRKNTEESELKQLAEFIHSLSDDIPWHISKYRPEYEYFDSPVTSLEELRLARSIGRQAGLKYIYLGNVSEGNNTVCPKCAHELINRDFYNVNIQIENYDQCPRCKMKLPGMYK